jgi:hypothetical protein
MTPQKAAMKDVNNRISEVFQRDAADSQEVCNVFSYYGYEDDKMASCVSTTINYFHYL